MPVAVLSDGTARAQVVVCDAAAARAGVRRGMAANAALALAPRLQLLERRPQREAQALQRLADAALSFTPAVSLEPPAALLLEIAGSLRLFGEPVVLREQVRAACQALGHCAIAAVTPTASSALWLAAAGCDSLIPDPAGLAGGLAALPIAVLPWPAASHRVLRDAGIRTLGDCARLPRDGLARRLGPERLRELDQAYGRIAEVRHWHQSAAQFREQLDMPLETANAKLLAAAADQLLDRLQVDMRRRQCAVQLLWLRLEHTSLPPTLLRIGLLAATSDIARLAELLRIHLDAAVLPDKVIALALEANFQSQVDQHSRQLFGAAIDPTRQPGAINELLERLRARLGTGAVHGIRALQEHRPEYAWQAIADPMPVVPSDSQAWPERPLWMLPEPLQLEVVAGQPRCPGPLEIMRGPERIENGWWDGRDIRRDYYAGRNHRGMCLWLFRDLRAGGWYLHGIFG